MVADSHYYDEEQELRTRSALNVKLDGSAPAPFYLSQTGRNFIEKSCRNSCKFIQYRSYKSSQKGNFQGILYNYPEPGPEPEPQVGFAAPPSRGKKK